ncbi:MAG TPA: hypothetical protein PLS71_03990 [Leptospiraceae bacterium]|nr:hypothetical protein [Leptospiraceae bacterium]
MKTFKYIRILFFFFGLFIVCNQNHSPKITGIFNVTTTTNSNTINNNYNYSISVIVSGLSGSMTVSLNSAETLTINANGSYAFTPSLNSGTTYTVSIQSYSSGQYCSGQNLNGVVGAANINISLTCQQGNSNGPLVGGTVFNPLNLSYTLTTIASGAMFNGINGVTTDGTLIYFTVDGNHTILKLDPSTNTVNLIAGQTGVAGFTDGSALSATFNFPEDLVYLNNALYITDANNGAIRKMDLATNIVSTLATGVTLPYGITTDGTYLYITESGKVTKISISTGFVTVLAGSGVTGFADGVGATAQFSPSGTINGGIAFDGTDLFVNDRGNCAIRKVIISSGAVSTIAGSPPPTAVCGTLLDGVGTASRINRADGIVSDGTNLYMADTNSCVIRQIQLSNLNVTTVAGLAGSCSLVDGTGSAARLANPALLASDGVNIYISDWGNNAIRKMN